MFLDVLKEAVLFASFFEIVEGSITLVAIMPRSDVSLGRLGVCAPMTLLSRFYSVLLLVHTDQVPLSSQGLK